MEVTSDSNKQMRLRVSNHDLFFQRVIAMIPRELYKPPEVDPIVANSKYHKHRRLPLEPSERKLLSKQKKQEVYDPEFKKTNFDDEDAEEMSDDDNGDEMNSEDIKLNLLKERLQKRIAGIKNNRLEDSKKMIHVNSSSSGKMKQPINNAKQLKNSKNLEDNVRSQLLLDLESQSLTSLSLESNNLTSDMQGDIEYGISAENVKRSKDFGKPGSKVKRLHELQEEIEKKRKRLEDYQSQGALGKQRIEKEKWGDVIQAASGNKILPDAGKISKALKRIEKSKGKSSREWQERMKELDEAKTAKSEKRENNLLRRKNIGNLPKSSDKNSSRPGFEGKKTEFLNKNTHGNDSKHFSKSKN